ncbi:MAG TPA: hypothetical protein VM537_31970 [Anaerolineae bacterium]|nr:hypothetical protein [Anaerolineae bacterium]
MADAERRTNSLSLFISLIDRPATALAEVAAHPKWRWLLPTILLVGAMVASIVLTSPLTTDQAQRTMQQQVAALPAGTAEMARAQIDRLQQPGFVLAMAIAGGLLGLALAWLLASAILYFSMVISGADLHFSALFATLPWVWLPFALRDVVQTGWILFRNRLIANPGLSYLVSSGKPLEDATNLLYGVLSYVDLFVLWHLVLVFVLARTLPRFSGGKAFMVTLIYAAISLGLRLLPVILGGSLLGTVLG